MNPLLPRYLRLDLDSATDILNTSLFFSFFICKIGQIMVMTKLNKEFSLWSGSPQTELAGLLAISCLSCLLPSSLSGSLRTWLMVTAVSISGHTEMILGSAGLRWAVTAFVVQVGPEALLSCQKYSPFCFCQTITRWQVKQILTLALGVVCLLQRVSARAAW